MNRPTPGSDRPAWKRILDLSRDLARAQSTGEQRQAITDLLQSELEAQVQLWLVPRVWQLPGGTGSEVFPPQPPSPEMRAAADTLQLVLAPAPDSAGPQIAAVPLVVRDSLLGVLQAQRSPLTPFTEDEITLLDCACSQFAMVLESIYLLNIDRWRASQLNLVREVSTQLANVLDLDALAERVTTLIQQTFDLYYVALFLRHPVREELVLKAHASRVELGADDATPRVVALGEGIIGHVGQTGEERIATDVDADPHYRRLPALPDTRIELAVPLKIGDRVVGVLDIEGSRTHELREADLLVLRALAESVAVAIDHAQLYDRIQRRAERFSVIAEANQAAASVLDQDTLLDQVAALIHEKLEFDAVRILTIDPVREQLIFRAGAGKDVQSHAAFGVTYELGDPTDVMPWVAAHGETVLENDVTKADRFPTTPLRSPTTRAEIAVPLVSSGQVLGVLDVQSDEQDAFGVDGYFLFRTLADSLATALRNADLYRTERWRRRVAESMRGVAGLLSSDMVLEDVLDAILLELSRALPADLATILLLEDGVLSVAAVRGVAAATELPAFHADSSSWIAEALAGEAPVVLPGPKQPDPIATPLGLPAEHAAIAAPMRAGGDLLGVIYLATEDAGRYGSESQVIMSAFASYAAVAIANARLYQASQEQALVSTVMLQVAESTQSLSSLNDVLDAIVRLTPLLVGISRCGILLWDASKTSLILSAAYGLEYDATGDLPPWTLGLDQLLVFEDLFLTRAALVVHDTLTDPRLAKTGLAALGFDSLLALPLLAQGETLGVMLVDYRGEMFTYDTGATVREERLTVVQGIAHQAAAAIENALLREAQQQEAYVSNALFQVAQTVANLSDLDDILSAIVRMTPILVGVERCVLLLWIRRERCFRVSHVYGVTREGEEELLNQRYGPGEFEFLDTIYELNEPSTYASPNGLGGRTDDPDAISPAFAQAIGYPTVDYPPLLGFPLAVRGDVLGILLLEEGQVPTNLREKRLEIISGIAQQTALALQNAQLQEERVGRERVEQELELAREIQQSLIPETLSKVEGWELAALWRAARETSGDFYDVIPLCSGKVGLLIGDVADKGMPAALFMVLTRTLVRAAALTTDSPARVLDQVNDLLVPDAKGGMFVTALYAVLSPSEGTLVLANAGHTPAIVRRAAGGTPEMLARGGMALGVVAGSRIEERIVQLAPGDTVVLSTDGVTEAYSPQGDLFGLDRLARTVAQSPASTAHEMVERVEHAVADHVETAPASDDLTLLVLRRSPAQS